MYQGRMFAASLLLAQPSTPPVPHWLTEATDFLLQNGNYHRGLTHSIAAEL